MASAGRIAPGVAIHARQHVPVSKFGSKVFMFASQTSGRRDTRRRAARTSPVATAPISRGRSMFSLALLAVTIFATISYEMLPIGLLGAISASFAESEQSAGLLMSAYAITVVVTAIPLAAVTARMDPRRLLVISLLFFVGVGALTSFAPALIVAILARFAGGLAHAMIFTVVFRLAISVVPKGREGVSAGVVSGANAAALSMGVPAATAIGVAAFWQLPFVVLTAAFAVLAVLIPLVLPRQSGAVEELTPRAVLNAVRHPAMLRVGLTTILAVTAQFASYTYIEPLLRDRGVADDSVGAVLFGYGAAGVVGLLIAIRFADRSPATVFRIMLGLVVVALVALIATNGSTVASIVAVIFWGFTFGSLPVLFQVLALLAARDTPSVGAPVNNSSFNIGIAGGAAVGGAVLAASNLVALLIFSVALMTVIFVLALLPRWLPRRLTPSVRAQH